MKPILILATIAAGGWLASIAMLGALGAL